MSTSYRCPECEQSMRVAGEGQHACVSCGTRVVIRSFTSLGARMKPERRQFATVVKPDEQMYRVPLASLVADELTP